MRDPELVIAGFYDHQQEDERRAPDWGGDDLFTSAPARRRRFERSPHPTRLRETHEHPLPARPQPAPVPHRVEPPPADRRTVTITGHPGATAVARRPSRTLDERIAHRPERVLAWSSALGFLLIALAIITAH